MGGSSRPLSRYPSLALSLSPSLALSPSMLESSLATLPTTPLTKCTYHGLCSPPLPVPLVHVAVTRLNLPEYCAPFAAGLLDCLIDIPFDIIGNPAAPPPLPGISASLFFSFFCVFLGIKFLWWTWHDTDSNIYERSYWVPWCSYIFHMTFATSFTFLMQNSRRYFTGSPSRLLCHTHTPGRHTRGLPHLPLPAFACLPCLLACFRTVRYL